MTKLSDLLIPIYKSLLPLCERHKISLNLDLTNPSTELPVDRRQFNATLKPHLLSALTRKPTTITLGTKDAQIYIKDNGKSLTKSEREQLTNETTLVHSRHGYGTTLTLKVPRA